MIIFLLCIIFLLVVRVPVFLSLLLPSMGYFLLNPELIDVVVVQRFIGGIESIPLLAIPFFVLAGSTMNYTGITGRLMLFCDLITKSRKGGLARVNILLSTLMGGISGSSLADAAMQSKMIVPQMEARGYSKSYAAVITAFSAVITPIIPPGIALILYGVTANVSIGKLFIAGVVPGIILCVTLIILSDVFCSRNPNLVAEKGLPSFRKIIKAFGSVFFAILIPLFIILGIRFGIFTPTEVGAVTVIISFIIGVLVYRELKLKEIPKILLEAALTTANIMLIIASASVFAWILSWEGITKSFSDFILQYVGNKYIFLLVANVTLLIIGTLIEGNALLIILVPVLMPIVRSLGINEVHFGIILIINLAIGSLTPPVGTVTLTVCNIVGLKIKSFIKTSWPFFALFLFLLGLFTYVPFFSTFLPDIFY